MIRPARFVFSIGVLFLLTGIFSQQLSAQWDFPLEVTVVKGKKKLEGATVALYKGSALAQQLSTPSNGKALFHLEQNAEYTLSVTKGGYVTKKLLFSTKGIPDDVAKEGFKGAYPTIEIFPIPTDPSVAKKVNSILSQPMAKFQYDDKTKDIDYDKLYAQSMANALEELSQLAEEAEKKAEEDAKKQAAMESAVASKYQAAIAKGDAAFGKKDYTTARAAYTEALDIKPGEAYPKGKIVEIEKLLADASKNAQLDADYKAAIAKADAALGAKTYASAKTSYNDALKLKPAEAYPKTKIAEIDKILADLANKDKAEKDKLAKEKELNDRYNAAIAKADKAFGAKDYPGAKAGYNEALGVKPAEGYPKTKIAEIDKLLADLAAKDKSEKDRLAKEKELNDKYNAAVAKGDQGMAAKDYNAAKAGYNEALGFKPAEQYPKTKLAEIDKLLADLANKDKAEKDKLAKEKELNDKYNAAIAKSDKALAAKDYTGAKAGYNEALGFKPAEAYPKTKIAEIDKLLADLASKEKDKALNDRYNAAVAKADKASAAKDYTGAKAGYNEALGIKPAEAYPKTKIAEIDKLLGDLAAKDKTEKDRLAKEKELNDKYNAAIAKGDKAFAIKDYTNAKAGYNEALGFKPAEAYPKTKIAEIDKLLGDLAAKDKAEKDRLAKEKELNDRYNAAIAKGDKAFAVKDYTNAKAGYNEALGVKPAEVYPKTKLAEIDKLLAELALKDKADKDRLAKEKELNDKYNAAVAKGDQALAIKDYTAAKAGYNEALGFKSAEVYPKTKIAEIDKLLADMAAKEKADKDRLARDKELTEKYNAAIAKADKALAIKDYPNAKAGYNEALGFKPAEQYPKTRIAEIDKLLSDLASRDKAEKDRLAKEKELNDKYAAAIKKGDGSFAAKDYPNALTAYKEAQTLKAAEIYPANKITEINKILDAQGKAKEKEQQYKDLIAKGDRLMASKDYRQAKTAFEDALYIKANEQYPKAKIAEIDGLMKKPQPTAAETAKSKDDFRNELAKKYPQGVTEENAQEGNVKVIRRIVVKGTDAHLYLKKITSFGAIYYFKDDSPITELEFNKDTEKK